MGKKAFYLDMLGKYIENQGEAPARIRGSLDDGDYSTAERLAHTAKGVSGNIGATEVQELAAQVEKAIREQGSREAIDSLLSPFADAQGKLVAGLREALVTPEVRAETIAAVDPDKAREIWVKITEYLEQDDSEAVDYLDAEREAFRGVLGPEQFASLDNALKQYNFGRSLEILREHAGKFHVAP
jgi:HPt (histidine-containing phosphotransfer) domain-containing protein